MDSITQFEGTIATFFGAKYAVATDSCTHAIELSLRITKSNNITVPKYTYPSIPMTLMKLGKDWTWRDDNWLEYYMLGNTNIIDAAVTWRRNSYVANTFMCVSFQYKKHLGLGRGGIILLDEYNNYKTLKKMVIDGRDFNVSWMKQNIDTLGYHYYMTPEIAKAGLKKFEIVKDISPKEWSWSNYVNLSNMSVFNEI